jgi:hypothetical protein
MGLEVNHTFSCIFFLILLIQILIMIIHKNFEIKYVYYRTLGKNDYRYEKTAKDIKNVVFDFENVNYLI